MPGWLLYESADAAANRRFIEKLQEELKPMELRLVYTDFIAQAYDMSYTGIAKQMFETMTPPTFAVNRSRNPHIAADLEELGIRVFNPAEVTRIGNDKDLSYALARDLSIKYMPYVTIDRSVLTPLTLIDEDRSFVGTESFNEICSVADDFGYPFVLKPSDGHGGKHVFLLNNEKELYSALQEILHTQRTHPFKKLLLQRKSAVPGKDLRLYLINNEIKAAMLRCAENKDEFRANFSLGGTASLIEPSKEEILIAEKIAGALSSDFIGIDIIYDKDGEPVFNEIEDAVGSRMLYTYTDMDPIRLFADHIRSSLGG